MIQQIKFWIFTQSKPIHIQKSLCTPFIVTLFIIATIWKQPKYLLIDKQIKNIIITLQKVILNKDYYFIYLYIIIICNIIFVQSFKNEIAICDNMKRLEGIMIKVK